MPNESLPTPQAEASAVAELAARVTTLERNARFWRIGFAAMCLVVVSMGAKAALLDGEFATVRATKFEVVGSDGETLGLFYKTKREGGSEVAVMSVSSADKSRASVIAPGNELLRVNK